MIVWLPPDVLLSIFALFVLSTVFFLVSCPALISSVVGLSRFIESLFVVPAGGLV